MFYGKGINEYNVDGKNATTHAEINAMNSLKFNKKNKMKKVFICTLTTNKFKGDKLITSRPCFNCLNYVYKTAIKKGYIIQRFYFFDESNNLTFYTKNDIFDINQNNFQK